MSRNAKAVKTKRDESEPFDKAATTQTEPQDEDPSHHHGERLVGSPRDGQAREVPDFETKMSEEPFRQKVDAICRRVFGKHGPLKTHTWEDLRQESLIQLQLAYEHFRGDSTLETYFETIVRNKLESLRRMQSARKRPDEVLDIALLVEKRWGAPTHELENSVLLKECRGKLTPQEWSLFTRYRIEGETQEKLAEELGISKQAVSGRLQRIVKKVSTLVDRPPTK